MAPKKPAVPTNKWIVTQITALGALTTAWVSADQWGKTLTIAAIGLITQAIVGYLCPNTDTRARIRTRSAMSPASDALNRS